MLSWGVTVTTLVVITEATKTFAGFNPALTTFLKKSLSVMMPIKRSSSTTSKE
jgi:hypothetical protein